MRFVAGVLLPYLQDGRTGLAHMMGIVKVEESIGQNGRKVFLIHASGNKRRGGSVKKVPLDAYIAGMQHVGAQVSRFTERSP